MHSNTKTMQNHQDSTQQEQTNCPKGQTIMHTSSQQQKKKPATLSTQPKVQQITNNLSRPWEENTTKQTTQGCPEPTLIRKSPLLPTLPVQTFIPGPSTVNSSRHTYIPRPSTFNNSRKSTFARPSEFNNHRFHQQHIPGPSPSPPRYNTYPTFSGPTINNYRYALQPHIPGPHTASPPCLHQGFFTRPYQQILGHLTPQIPYIFTRKYQQISGHPTPQVCYLPVILPHPLQHYTT